MARQPSRNQSDEPANGKSAGGQERLALVPDADPARAHRERIIAELRRPFAGSERDAYPPGKSAQARLHAAAERDEVAHAGDLAALERDRAAERRNLAMARGDGGAVQDAEYRELAARDRHAAARDRQLAARERLRALVDREALAREAPTPSSRG